MYANREIGKGFGLTHSVRRRKEREREKSELIFVGEWMEGEVSSSSSSCCGDMRGGGGKEYSGKISGSHARTPSFPILTRGCAGAATEF